MAVHSGDVITMTDDEKKRLQELLSDVDHLPEQVMVVSVSLFDCLSINYADVVYHSMGLEVNGFPAISDVVCSTAQ